MDDLSADTFIGRLWRLPGVPARRGRPSRLDVETVVSTAVGSVDSDGLEGAALPRLADELGVTAMSLYRHDLYRRRPGFPASRSIDRRPG